MEVLLAHLDALRHRTASPQQQQPSNNGSNSNGGGSVSAEELRGAFGQASAAMATYWPTYLDRLLRWECELLV
jgi:hypothetical protein